MSPASVLSAAREAKAAPCSIARNNNTGPATIGTALSQPPIRGPQRRLPSVTPAMKSGTSVSLRAKSMVEGRGVPAVRAHRAPLFEEKAASLRQAVEALGPSGQDLTLRLRRQLTAVGDQLGRAGEEAVGMRIVGRPQDLVGPDVVGEDAQAALDRLERDPAVALEQLARPHRQAGVVEALVVEVTVHAIEPRRDPAAAGFEEGDAHLRMAIAHAAPDDAHGGQHHLHRVRDDVLGAARFEAIDADLRHAAAGALVQADREIQLLDLVPEPIVVGVMEHAPVVGVRPQEARAHAETVARVPHLLDGGIDRLHRQHGDAEETVRVRLAVIGEPAVVRAADGGGERRILDGAGEESDARIEEGGVDAVEVHVGDARVRIEAALAPIDVLHRLVFDLALPRADRADHAEALLAAEHLTLDVQALLAIRVAHDPRRAIAELGIDVLVPDVDGLEHVTVGVDDVVGSRHGGPPLGRCGDETTAPRGRQDRRASRIARHTRSGVAGISMCSTPSSASASTTALIVAASAGVVPPSPPPRKPSGFVVEGTSLISVVKFGRLSARGSA